MHFRDVFPPNFQGDGSGNEAPEAGDDFHPFLAMFSQIIFQKVALFHVVAVQQTGFLHTEVLPAQTASWS